MVSNTKLIMLHFFIVTGLMYGIYIGILKMNQSKQNIPEKSLLEYLLDNK